MAQLQLPIFPEGMTQINTNLGFVKKEGTVTYIYGRSVRDLMRKRIQMVQKTNRYGFSYLS